MRRRRAYKATPKQMAALRKGWRILGTNPKNNPGTAAGAAKARRRKARKSLTSRRRAAKRFARAARGFHVVVRRRAGRRKANKRFTRSYGIVTGKKGTIAFRRKNRKGVSKLVATNPRRKKRRNPPMTLASWRSGLTGLTSRVPGLFRGKDMLPQALIASGGMVGGIVVGGMARGTIMGMLAKIAPAMAENKIVNAVAQGVITYTGGYAVGQVLIKNDRKRGAFITGAAVAAILGALFPGRVNALLTSLPGVGPILARLPGMSGLGAYVSAPGYQGVGAYVSAPGYQGVGAYPGAMLAGDPAIAGIGNDDALAGVVGAYVSAPGYQGVGDGAPFARSHLD